MIDFTSSDSTLLLNPRLMAPLKAKVENLFEKKLLKELYKAHIFLATSGSTKKKGDAFKLVALSKQALLASARSVNKKLDATKKDVWLNCLPVFHVGGLGIYARAFLSLSKVILLEKWDLSRFMEEITWHEVTLTSLVPAQVYDLVNHKIKAPKTLRGVIVGGGALSAEIGEEAVSLGWPLILTYGLTECSSQVATSNVWLRELFFLDHIEAKISQTGFLMIRSPSLLTAEILIFEQEIKIRDPKEGGWFQTEDLVAIQGSEVIIHGRSTDFIKIGGESVHFSKLEKVLETVKLKHHFKEDAVLIRREDKRLGVVIELVATTKEIEGFEIEALVENFNKSVMPYEAIRKVHFVGEIPRTALKKVKESELLNILNHKCAFR